MKNVQKIAKEIVAGVWALPSTFEKLNKLENTINDLKEGKLKKTTPHHALYSVIGNDDLFDKIDEEERIFQKSVYHLVINYLKQLIKDYENSPQDFKEKLDIEQLKKLSKL